MKELSPEQMLEAGKWWIARLGLQVWQIKFERGRHFDIDGLGQIQWTLSKRVATITLMERNDLSPENTRMNDEVCIVHELLHLVTAAWYDRTTDGMTRWERDICVEQPIELLSELLVKLRREFTAWQFSWERGAVKDAVIQSTIPLTTADTGPEGAD